MMMTTTLSRETANYWETLKDASEEVKLSLISLLSASLVSNNAKLQGMSKTDKPHITREDLEITPFVATFGQNIKPIPSDFDYKKAKEEYLIQKYG